MSGAGLLTEVRGAQCPGQKETYKNQNCVKVFVQRLEDVMAVKCSERSLTLSYSKPSGGRHRAA